MRLHLSPGHQDVDNVVIVVDVIVSSLSWSYSTTIMVILYTEFSFKNIEMSFLFAFVSYCLQCPCQSWLGLLFVNIIIIIIMLFDQYVGVIILESGIFIVIINIINIVTVIFISVK